MFPTLLAIALMLALDLVFVAILLAVHVPLAMFRPAAYAVVRRNFIGYFTNPSGYVFLIVFVILTSMATFLPPSFFNDNLANLEQLNTFIPLILLVFVPTITMSIWAEERRQGTDELLLTLPATDFDIVIGKYLSAVNIFTASLLFSKLSVTTVLSALARGDLDFGLLYANYFGYWLIGLAMIAVGMAASFLTSNLTVGFILGVLFNAPLALLGWVGQILTSAWYTRFLFAVSFGGLFDDFRRGIFSVSSLVGFLTVVVAGIYLCMALIGRRHWPSDYRGLLSALHESLRFLAILLIGIGLWGLLNRYDVRQDVTGSQISSPSPESMQLIERIVRDYHDPEKAPQHPIVIDAYVSDEMPKEFVQTRYDLISLLKEINARGGDAIRVNLYQDISVNGPDAVAAEKRYGIRSQRFTTTEQEQIRTRDVILGAAIQCGLDKIVIPLFEYGVPVEYELIRSINTVAKADRKKIGVVRTDVPLMGGFSMAGGQPRQLEKSELIVELEKQYDVVDVNPEQAIDTSAFDVLIVVQPSSLSPAGMTNLVTALKTGIPAAVFEDPFPSFWGGVPGTADPRTPAGMMGMFGGAPPPKGDFRSLLEALELNMVGEFDRGQLQPNIIWQDFNPYQQFPLPAELVFIVSPGAGLDVDPFHQAETADGKKVDFGPEAGPLPDITAGIDQVLFPWPGGVTRPAKTTLPHNTLVSTFAANGAETLAEFQAANQPGNTAGLDLLHQRTVRGDTHFDLAVAVGDFASPPTTREDRKAKPPAKPADADKADADATDKPEADGAETAKTDAEKSDAEEADAETPDDAADVPVPPVHPVRAVFVADIDLLSDTFFAIRARPAEGVEFRIENVALVLNLLDVLAGDSDYARIRTRKPEHKPLVVMEGVIERANDSFRERVKEEEERRQADETTAQEEFDAAVAKIREEAAKLQQRIDAGERVDPREMMILNERLQLTQRAAQKRLDVKAEAREKDFERDRRDARQQMEQKISSTQFSYKALAVLLPTIPPLIVGIGVFLYRRFQELEGISTVRLR